MAQLYDSQMANVADYDCFSQVVFESLEDYKRMKQDPWYKQHLVGDHEKFADTKRSRLVPTQLHPDDIVSPPVPHALSTFSSNRRRD